MDGQSIGEPSDGRTAGIKTRHWAGVARGYADFGGIGQFFAARAHF